MEINPCKECQERYIGCHGKCEKYQDWKIKHQEQKIEIFKAHEFEAEGYEIKKAIKRLKQREKQK